MMNISKHDKDKLLKKGYFRLARIVSLNSDMWPKMGAVISKKSVISVGWNMNKTTTWKDYLSIHAELKALIYAGNVFDCDVYIYREDIAGNPKMARPCNICMGMLRDRNIKNVYYTIDEYPYWRKERVS